MTTVNYRDTLGRPLLLSLSTSGTFLLEKEHFFQQRVLSKKTTVTVNIRDSHVRLGRLLPSKGTLVRIERLLSSTGTLLIEFEDSLDGTGKLLSSAWTLMIELDDYCHIIVQPRNFHPI